MKKGNVLDDFEWCRAVDGYRWEGRTRKLLVPVQDDGKPTRYVRYQLTDKPGTALFMAFAELGDDPANHLAFANQYGLLGPPVTVATAGRMWEQLDAEDLLDSPTPGIYEPDKYGALFGEFFAMDPDRFPMASWLNQSKLLAQTVRAREKRAGDGENWMLLRRVNMALHLGVRSHVVPADTDEGFELRITPISLIGAMWLQAAHALSRPKEFRRCPVCGNLIEVARNTGARKDATFCSDPCKSKDYRDRRAAARKLAARSVPAAQIAKKTKTKLATVKKWLDNKE